MSITIYPELETRLRERAQAEGVTIDAYVERLLLSDQEPASEIEQLALAGIQSGDPFEPGPEYWEAKHRLLDARLKSTNAK